jgi:diguanylate cyclase (GGDEF)-like protein
MDYNNFVRRVLDSYVGHLSKKAIFVKQNCLSNDEVRDIFFEVTERNDIRALHHEYNLCEMKDAYEPFLSWIKDSYYKYYEKDYTIEEFLKKAEVYSLHQEVLGSYIRDGICKRTFEVMIEEYEYEHERMLYSIYHILKLISENEPLVLCIRKLHMAPESVLKLINYIFNSENNIHFIFSFGESFLIKDYCRDEWEKLLKEAAEGNMILEWKQINTYHSEEYPDEFIYKEGMIEEYIRLITNMYHTFTFKDAYYYMNMVYSYISREAASETDEENLRFLELMAYIHLGRKNYKECLFTCENMLPLIVGKDYVYWEFVYNYLSAKSHMTMTESLLVYKFCDKCKKLLKKLNDEKLLMNVEIVETITHFGSLKDIFKCDYNYKISEEVIERVKKFNNENVLAYMYIFDSVEDKETIRKIGNEEVEAERFNEGVAIAQKLDNRNVLLLAYMKNIIIYSEYGLHKYVTKMYEKRISIVDNSKPVRIAHMYGGLGYNSIVIDDYVKADEYLRKSLDILVEHNRAEDLAEIIYNMIMNYFVANINDKVVECANLLFKVMNLINIQSIRICNTSKIYGIEALAYYKLGEYYDCYYCFNKMETYLSYVLNKADEENEKLWLEDLFLYHLCKANMSTYENNYEEAKKEFALAYKYMEKHTGTKYYSYAEYALGIAELYNKCGDENSRVDILTKAYDYCIKHNYMLKATLINAKIHRLDYQVNRAFADKPLPVKAIIDNCSYVGVQEKLNSREKDIEFLTICHDAMIREQNSVEDVINNSMDVIQNSYNFDRILLLERDEENTYTTFSYGEMNVSQKEREEIFEFFDKYRTEFISSRVDKSFNVYNDITSKINLNEIVTIVGIPVFVDGKITRVFIGTVDIHRSFTGNRKLLNKSNLVIIKYAISQLDEAVKRIKKGCMIKIMNEELEKTAFTDQLTGIYNRMGLDKMLKDDIAENGIVLYMDLDDFKKYNDTYGHGVGDLIIKEFAHILYRNVAKFGYAIRYGGDEFVAVLPSIEVEEGDNLANTIEKDLIENNTIKEAICGNVISASIGIARYLSATRQGIETALKLADKALYEVKKEGKGKVAIYRGE